VLLYRRARPASGHFDVALELTDEDVLTSPMLPDFALPVSEVFALA